MMPVVICQLKLFSIIVFNLHKKLFGSKFLRNGVLSWVCVTYALLVVAIGFTLPIILGIRLVESPRALDEYIDFYSILYAIGLLLLTCHHFAAGTPLKLLKFFAKFFRKIRNCCGHKSNGTVNEKKEEHEEKVELTSGRQGLKFGIKISFVVLIIMILMELSAFIEIKLEDPECDYGSRTTDVVLFLLYIFLQTHFVMATKQEDLQEKWFLNHLCVAHMIATTICLGVFMTTQDCLFKLLYLYFQLTEEESKDKSNSTEGPGLPEWMNNYKETIDKERLHRATFNITNPCSLENYVKKINHEIKPFTYHFNMFYIYCVGILLTLLFIYLRKQIYTGSKASNFFKTVNSKSASFQSGAGLSLIVISVVTAILTIHAETNTFVGIFLILLHMQATFVAIFALVKISAVPCSMRKDSSKYPVIFLVFYFFVVLLSVFKAIIFVEEAREDPNLEIILEVLVEVADIIQAFIHGVLILIGYYTVVSPEVLRHFEMPTHILIHLAATNLASLISAIFTSESNLGRLEEMFRGSDSVGETDATIAWTVLDSIVSPAEEFSRFFTIICLVKLHKYWSPPAAEHDNKVETTRI